jgi:hypothetical protein
VIPALIGYLCVGFLVGLMSLLILDEEPWWCPKGAEPAAMFLIGLLWPLSITVGVGSLLLRGVLLVVGGFVVLWRAWQPPAPSVPRATARRRQP